MRPREAAYWLAAPLLCLALHWHALASWFRADDFAWLGLGLGVHDFRGLLHTLFAPMAQGTIRPLSERAFFLGGYALFGLHPLPFRIAVFATQIANLTLVTAMGDRLTGRRGAGLAAAVLWTLHSAMTEPLGWASAYNQVLAAFFLLAAFYCLLRGWRAAEWALFLAGFGAQELNAVYPAIALAYLYGWDRKHWRRALPMFAVSAAYLALHARLTPPHRTGDYAMHFTGAMLRTLGRYWMWSVGPSLGWTPGGVPWWIVPIGVAAVTLGLLAFGWRRRRLAGFCLAWFVLALAPVLPLRDHRMEYYVFVPLIGLCWLGGWALVDGRRTLALALAAVYLIAVVPRTVAASAWNWRMADRARRLVEGVAAARALHPGKALLLDGMDDDLYWNTAEDHPFALVGADSVYLAPGTPAAAPEFTLAPDLIYDALDHGRLEVYDVRGPRLRNITFEYSNRPRDLRLPLRIDAGSPLTAPLLGPEWYAADGDHRWMPAVATLRMGAPARPGNSLYVRGVCTAAQLPLTVTAAVEGQTLAPAVVRQTEFEAAFPLPDAVVGLARMQVVLRVSRTVRPPNDPRDLGIALGVVEIR
jgi:hypothetical protein